MRTMEVRGAGKTRKKRSKMMRKKRSTAVFLSRLEAAENNVSI